MADANEQYEKYETLVQAIGADKLRPFLDEPVTRERYVDGLIRLDGVWAVSAVFSVNAAYQAAKDANDSVRALVLEVQPPRTDWSVHETLCLLWHTAMYHVLGCARPSPRRRLPFDLVPWRATDAELRASIADAHCEIQNARSYARRCRRLQRACADELQRRADPPKLEQVLNPTEVVVIHEKR